MRASTGTGRLWSNRLTAAHQTKTSPESNTTTDVDNRAGLDGVGAIDVALLQKLRKDNAVGEIGGRGLYATADVHPDTGLTSRPGLGLRHTGPGQHQTHQEPSEPDGCFWTGGRATHYGVH